MKGVLLGRTDARLVDVTHDFPRQDVRTTAFWLREVLPYFPPSVHLVVVDPGVGTTRDALVVRAGEHALVGPDNGVLLPAARRLAGAADGIEPFEIVVENPESHTFHGRDVFAPAAAAVHEAGPGQMATLDRLTPTEDVEDLRFPDPAIEARGATGEVLVIDGFGNVITNVPGSVLEGRFGETVSVNGESVSVARSYAGVGRENRLVTVGSHGKVELAVNRGRGDRAFDIEVGDGVDFVW